MGMDTLRDLKSKQAALKRGLVDKEYSVHFGDYLF